ncbi:MAG TPA: hypothetical protein VIG49_03300 [Acetobacteraceae bacterium]
MTLPPGMRASGPGGPAAGVVVADNTRESAVSAMSWAAIIGGAVAAIAVSFMLAALGSGIGLTSVSPWSGAGASPATFTVLTAIWLIIVQWLSSGIGGYLTGRLRTKWVGTHTDEVFFRDTAHGFLTWALASVVVVGLTASTLASIVGGGVHAATTVAAGATQGAAAQSNDATGYAIDTLFRPTQPQANAPAPDVRGEATRILAKAVTSQTVNADDRSYLSKLVAARTGISEADAGKRIDDLIAQGKAAELKIRQAADAARKAASSLSFFIFFSMLVGAFIASVAAALGGRQRDAI